MKVKVNDRICKYKHNDLTYNHYMNVKMYSLFQTQN